jgi:IclR family acetate operon transcriptional repressor
MQSADKALAILAAFDETRPDLGVSELAGELGMHKSTVSRLLAALERRGLVRREGERFAPGPELARLGVLAVRGLTLPGVARPSLEELAERTGETVNLAVREGDRALNLLQVDAAHFVGVTDWTGRAAPLHASANGKALLAFGDGRSPGRLTKLTTRTIVDRDELRADLVRARAAGFAVAVEELELGLHAVAAPVYDSRGTCLAAVSVSGPAYRLTQTRLPAVGKLCADAAAEVSARLGFRRAA